MTFDFISGGAGLPTASSGKPTVRKLPSPSRWRVVFHVRHKEHSALLTGSVGATPFRSTPSGKVALMSGGGAARGGRWGGGQGKVYMMIPPPPRIRCVISDYNLPLSQISSRSYWYAKFHPDHIDMPNFIQILRQRATNIHTLTFTFIIFLGL